MDCLGGASPSAWRDVGPDGLRAVERFAAECGSYTAPWSATPSEICDFARMKYPIDQ